MMEQRTDEWHAARLGKVTASRIKDVMMKPTTAGYQNYLSQLVLERLTGKPTETFTSAAMQHGTDTEPQARASYTLLTGASVQEVGFVDHPTLAMTGMSPDGLVGERGLVEIKCPQPTEHIRLLTGGSIKRDYVLQMQWQMECSGREWCDFVSFNPDFPAELEIFDERVFADSSAQREIAARVEAFLSEVDAMHATLIEKLEAA